MSLPLPIQLDGAAGGQVLRTALSLALVTGVPFRVEGFRAGRPSEGLRPRHLALLRAAEAVGGTAEGATLGGAEVSFVPAPVRRGDYVLELGPTGSAPLVFQMLAFPLALAGGGTVRLRGLNPLVILLAILSAVSFATGDARAGTVMAVMVALSVGLRFLQQARADTAAAKL